MLQNAINAVTQKLKSPSLVQEGETLLSLSKFLDNLSQMNIHHVNCQILFLKDDVAYGFSPCVRLCKGRQGYHVGFAHVESFNSAKAAKLRHPRKDIAPLVRDGFPNHHVVYPIDPERTPDLESLGPSAAALIEPNDFSLKYPWCSCPISHILRVGDKHEEEFAKRSLGLVFASNNNAGAVKLPINTPLHAFAVQELRFDQETYLLQFCVDAASAEIGEFLKNAPHVNKRAPGIYM